MKNQNMDTASCSKSCSSRMKMLPWFIALILIVIIGVTYSQSTKMTRDTQDKMVAPVAMMNTEAQTPAMMKKEEVKPEAMMMKKEESTMMKSETGYGVYSDATLATALQAGQKIYIFFHATWCPSCQALDGNIRENISSIPANVLILKADYDTETSLKQKYGVTVQTTVIALNTEGSLAKKTIGVTSVAELLK